jgi:hypothetical protein
MDPVTLAIVAALAVGVSIEGIKTLFKRKFGGEQGDLVKALEKLAANPQAEGDKYILNGQILNSKANSDPEVLQAVAELQKEVDAKRGSTSISITSSGVGSAISGTGSATVTNTWGSAPPQEPRQQP